MAEERTPVIEDKPAPDTRMSRDSETRREEERPNATWMPTSNLPTPDPRDGLVFRWIRTASLGNADNANVSKRMREGWTPVSAEDHPELKILSDIGSRFEGNIEIGGLMLCKMPQEMVDQRSAHYQKMADSQMDAVDNSYMRENDPRMPLLAPERSTRTQFGKG
jgi:hypothetical protein